VTLDASIYRRFGAYHDHVFIALLRGPYDFLRTLSSRLECKQCFMLLLSPSFMHPWPPGGVPQNQVTPSCFSSCTFALLSSNQQIDRENVEKRCSNDDCMVEDLKVIDANGGCKRNIRRKRCSGRGTGQFGPPDDPKNALIYERQLDCQIVT
jgi:hypothetical protein